MNNIVLKMKGKTSFIIGLFILQSFCLTAQNHYDIRLNPIESNNTKTVCYNIQLASADRVDLNLAGQNYRIYYDSEFFRFNWEKSGSLLPKEKYTPLIIKDNYMEVDASGKGTLSFENHLGFLNVGLDLADTQNGGVVLTQSGEWLNTAQICFDFIQNENSVDYLAEQQLFWARPELTDTYATAYVEIAEWISESETQPIIAADYQDVNLTTSFKEQQWEQKISIYPNPTQGKTQITHDGSAALSIAIWSLAGKQIQTIEIPKGKTTSIIDLAQLPSGIYQFEIIGANNKRMNKKVEKIK